MTRRFRAADALVDLLDALTTRPLPPLALVRAREAVANAAADMLAGSTSAAARIAQRLPGRCAAAGAATVAGTALRASFVDAALLNGLAVHALDWDDMNATLFGHPSCTLVPAILACVEAVPASGGVLLAAYIAGLEVDARLGRIANPDHYRRGWHATATLGVLGATAAASRMLGLAPDTTRHALGTAASAAGGLRANFGTMTKALHAGRAAAEGVHAALLARAGYTASSEALDGPSGFFAALGASHATPAAIRTAFDPAAPLEIVRAGIGYKPYACCGCATAAMDALLELRTEHALAAEDVTSIECRIHPLARDVMPYAAPADELQAKYSLSWCLAVVLADGVAGIEQFQPARLADPAVHDLRARIEIRDDASLPLADGNFAGRVEIAMNDGRRLARRVDVPRGDPRRPIEPHLAQAKFDVCARRAGMAPARVERLRDLLARLPDLPDAALLAGALAVPPE